MHFVPAVIQSINAHGTFARFARRSHTLVNLLAARQVSRGRIDECHVTDRPAFLGTVLAAVLASGLSAACASRADTRLALPQDERALPQDGRGHKSYIVPAVEIVA